MLNLINLAAKPLTPEKMKKLESLRSRPRRRPDWSDMMKEVESGKKLKHVECNDRSAPIITSTKSKGQVSIYCFFLSVFNKFSKLISLSCKI